MHNKDVFAKCPTYETEHFILRKMEISDSKDLFLCYSNKEAARHFNGDSCNDDFYYTDYEAFLNVWSTGRAGMRCTILYD